MGHSRMGVLPATRRWREVVELISGGADVAEIAAAASKAAETSMERASDDPAVPQSMFLLARIPLAARATHFEDELKLLGLRVPRTPTLIEIGTALMEAVDRHVDKTGGRTDLGEMTQISAVESLTAVVGRGMPGLVGTSNIADDARTALKGLATVRQFSVLVRDFFARLTRRYLDYYLSRELANHVGVNERFQTLREHQQFDEAVGAHCREASRILDAFAGEWFSKTTYEGGITQAKAGRFAHVAFDKMRKELRVRRGEAAQ